MADASHESHSKTASRVRIFNASFWKRSRNHTSHGKTDTSSWKRSRNCTSHDATDAEEAALHEDVVCQHWDQSDAAELSTTHPMPVAVNHERENTGMRLSRAPRTQVLAEKKFKNAVDKIKAVASKGTTFEFPEADGLHVTGDLDNVDVVARTLIVAIDNFIDDRTERIASHHQQRKVKDVVQQWFEALFPAVRSGLKGLNVTNPILSAD